MNSAELADAAQETRNRWKEYLTCNSTPLLSQVPIQECLIPLFGTAHFSKLSDLEKRRLYFSFAQFNSEVIIFLEDLLLLSFRRFSQEVAEPGTQVKMKSLIFDEGLHAQGFRKFLRNEPELFWPHKKFVLGSAKRICDSVMIWIARKSPTSLTIPGARFEAYSIHLSHYISKLSGDPLSNEWAYLNHLHMLDEVRHVPFEFDLSRETHSLRPQWMTFIGALLFILMSQWILIRAVWKMLDSSLESPTWVKKVYLTPAIVFWTVRKFPPYQQTRRQIRSLLDSKNPPFGWMYRLVTW